MVTVMKEVDIDGETKRYPIFVVPCDMETFLELSRPDMDELKEMRIAVEWMDYAGD